MGVCGEFRSAHLRCHFHSALVSVSRLPLRRKDIASQSRRPVGYFALLSFSSTCQTALQLPLRASMSDTKWGFDKEYGHKSCPSKWSTSGFTVYNPTPLLQKSFRRQGLPVQMEDLGPPNTAYTERPQTTLECMSAYGCHRDPKWDNMLRSPRNPFPGKATREMNYSRQASPLTSPRSTPCRTPRANTSASLPPSRGKDGPHPAAGGQRSAALRCSVGQAASLRLACPRGQGAQQSTIVTHTMF